MHKDFVPPVSFEEFAAYLDGNLTEDGMIANYEPLQLTVPEDILSTDFEIPQLDDNDYLNIGDWADLDVAACAADSFEADAMGTENDSSSMADHIGLDEDSSDITSDHLETDLSDTMSHDELIDFDNTDLNDL